MTVLRKVITFFNKIQNRRSSAEKPLKFLIKIAGTIWKRLPPQARLRAVRATQSKFTASAAAVVVNENSEVLLLNHVLRPFGTWGLPGGFLDRSEQPEEALRREVREEVGIELGGIKLVRVRTAGRHIEMIFSANFTGEARVLSREISELGWFGREAVREKTSGSQLAIIEKVLDSEV
jgi:ADP-ribose pyrophosphatase YjhB (NUDIX family)